MPTSVAFIFTFQSDPMEVLPFSQEWDEYAHDTDDDRLLPPLPLVNTRPLDGTPFIAPYVPCPDEIVSAAIAFARLTHCDTLADLGCGDARIIRTALDTLVLHAALGVELDPILFNHAAQSLLGSSSSPDTCRLNPNNHEETTVVHATYKNTPVWLLKQDMFAVDLDHFDVSVLILYLLPAGLDRLFHTVLSSWIEAHAAHRRHRRIVTIQYAIPNVSAKEQLQVGKYTLYKYTAE